MFPKGVWGLTETKYRFWFWELCNQSQVSTRIGCQDVAAQPQVMGVQDVTGGLRCVTINWCEWQSYLSCYLPARRFALVVDVTLCYPMWPS
jgi:hypothetical protein